MYLNNKILVGKNKDKELCILLDKANRHGLITGASGSGKTITLKVMAESFSSAGVPVFLADVKGDLAGTAKKGEASEALDKRLAELNIPEFDYEEFPVRFWDLYQKFGHALRASIYDIGPSVLSIMLGLTEVQEGVLTIIYRIAKDEQKMIYDISDLKKLLQTTYFKDILEHNKLYKSEALDSLCNILSECIGQPINAQKISNTYESVTKKTIDDQTVERYIRHFMDAFLLREAKRYDVKGRHEIGARRKYYFVDTGLRNARLDFVFPDEGQLIENIIYNELIYNGYSVNVGTYEKVEKDADGKSVRKPYEIDFYARKNNRFYYIQATADMSNEKTKAREIKPFVSLKDEIQKVLVVNKPIGETRDENGFTVVGLTEFLLRFIKA